MKLMDADGGFPNLKGAAIGDGCWGNKVGLCCFECGKAQQISMQTFFGHSMISNQRKASLEAACAPWSDASVQEAACEKELNAANNEIGRFDIYNIYDTCAGDTSSWSRSYFGWRRLLAADTINVQGHQGAHPQLSGALNDYPCGGDAAASAWLGQDAVAKALHVKTAGSMRYNKGPDDFSGNLLPLYQELIPKYRMLIYSGDTDA
jgi:hypothetical protein